jgi:hypothetical protein
VRAVFAGLESWHKAIHHGVIEDIAAVSRRQLAPPSPWSYPASVVSEAEKHLSTKTLEHHPPGSHDRDFDLCCTEDG